MPEPAIPETEIIGDNVPSTALYRLYDDGGVLLYVGIADDLRKRFAQHKAEKLWWPEVTRKTVTWYGTRTKAFCAEDIAIKTEYPVFNRAGVPRANFGASGAPKGHRPPRLTAEEVAFFFETP